MYKQMRIMTIKKKYIVKRKPKSNKPLKTEKNITEWIYEPKCVDENSQKNFQNTLVIDLKKLN